MKNSWTKLQ